MIEYTIFSIKIIILLFSTDQFLTYQKKQPLIRWYWVHALSNMIISYYTFIPMVQILSDPIDHIINPTRFEESTIIVAIIHLYHLCFFNCTKSDWVHHLLFVLLGTISHYLVNWGYITALYHFFICGFPGGIDYIALALVKEKRLLKINRLKLAVELNTWIRSPGIIISWAFGYIWYIYNGTNFIHLLCFIVMTIGSVINAQYYSRQVTLYAGKHAY